MWLVAQGMLTLLPLEITPCGLGVMGLLVNWALKMVAHQLMSLYKSSVSHLTLFRLSVGCTSLFYLLKKEKFIHGMSIMCIMYMCVHVYYVHVYYHEYL